LAGAIESVGTVWTVIAPLVAALVQPLVKSLTSYRPGIIGATN
jgi:hypothetical protein